MAHNLPSVPGAERIRAITDEDGMYKAFDAYPWKRDKMFMSGLYAILGDPDSDDQKGSLTEMANHARIFYYAQRIGVVIDFAKYKTWLDLHPDHVPADVLPQEFKALASRTRTAGSSSQTTGRQDRVGDIPVITQKLSELKTGPPPRNEEVDTGLDWQKAAPRAELYVDRKRAAQADSSGSGGSESEPNYPLGFAKMLEMIQKGMPIPGIRQIPDTIVRDPTVKPVGQRTVPLKPWEKRNLRSDSSEDGAQDGSLLDKEFPALDTMDDSDDEY